MKRSLMAIALMACASFVCASVVAVRTAMVSAYRFAKSLVLDGFKLAAGEGSGLGRPMVVLVQAKAFVMRLAKHERPELTGSWRMCLST